MIRAKTIKHAVEKPVERHAPVVKLVPQIPVPQIPTPQIPQPDLSVAILDMGKTAEQNALMLREAIDKITSVKHEPIRKWVFDIVADMDIHSPRYGMTKQIIATADDLPMLEEEQNASTPLVGEQPDGEQGREDQQWVDESQVRVVTEEEKSS